MMKMIAMVVMVVMGLAVGVRSDGGSHGGGREVRIVQGDQGDRDNRALLATLQDAVQVLFNRALRATLCSSAALEALHDQGNLDAQTIRDHLEALNALELLFKQAFQSIESGQLAMEAQTVLDARKALVVLDKLEDRAIQGYLVFVEDGMGRKLAK